MSDRAFFDTNILIYSLSHADAKKRERATALMRDAVMRRTGVISYQVVQEMLNVSLRAGAERMTVEEAGLYFAELRSDFEVVGWSDRLVEQALHVKASLGFHWYDCLIVAAALESGCGVLYTEDLQNGQSIEGMKVVNPFR